MTKRDQIIIHYERKIAKYETRLTATDALAEKIKQYENDRDFYIPQGIIDALREYEATK